MTLRQRTIDAVIAASAVCLIAAGCSPEDHAPVPSSASTEPHVIAGDGAPVMQPEAAPSTSPDDPKRILADQVRAAEQTIRRGLEAMFTWYPSTDKSPADAIGRATRYLTADMAKTSNSSNPTLQWTRWKEAGASVIAAADIQADEPDQKDSATQVKRVVAIVQHVDTGRGAPTSEPPITAWVTASQTSGGWRISAMAF